MHVIKLSTYEIQLARGVAAHRDGRYIARISLRTFVRARAQGLLHIPGFLLRIRERAVAAHRGNLGRATRHRLRARDRARSRISIGSYTRAAHVTRNYLHKLFLRECKYTNFRVELIVDFARARA